MGTQEILLAALFEVTQVKLTAMKMNPKAISTERMYGWIDRETRTWTDGIFSELFRDASHETRSETWVVLDGPGAFFFRYVLSNNFDNLEVISTTTD